jgi:dolichyl-phosphate-mannose--protein O-mannosyl transferase
LISLALHLFVIPFPSDGGKVFDEANYVQACLDLIDGKASNLEHPFVGKAWAGLSIAIFGNSWFAWRIPSVIFGLFTIWIFFGLSRHFLNEYQALYAAAFLAFENIFFTHSSLLLLDIAPLFFGISGIYLYLEKRCFFAALALALSTLSKEWGVMFAAIVIIYHLFQNRRLMDGENLRQSGKFLLIYISVIFLAIWAYDFLYQPVVKRTVIFQSPVIAEVNGNNRQMASRREETVLLKNPVDHFQYMLAYHTSLVMKTNDIIDVWNNLPWGWISPFHIKAPIYFQTTLSKNVAVTSLGKTIKSSVQTSHPITWTGMGNLFIWLTIWLIAPFCVFRVLTGRGKSLDRLILIWIAVTYLPWFYVSLGVRRVVYSFYFINTVPALCLGIPHLIASVFTSAKTEKIILSLWLALTIGFFFYYFPVNVFQKW